MRFGTSRLRGRAARIAGAALLGGLLVGASQPARAGNFERAFEYELGRLTAVEVFRVGHFLLSSALAPRPGYGVVAPGPAYAPPPPRPVRPRPAYRPPPPPVYQAPPHAAGPCTHPSHGERTVYERYERTVTPPPPVYYPQPY